MANYTEDFSFLSKYIEVKESTLHYIDEGVGSEREPVFLFLHGNPTSGYLWRNIIAQLKHHGRCIAPDLIGFGKSGKPDLEYTFQDHFSYISEFIRLMNLKNIILVVHDWGGAIGFHYARLNTEKIRGIVFMETFYKPMEWQTLDPFAQFLFKMFRKPKVAEFLNGRLNLFVNFILPLSMYHILTRKEKMIYKAPFSKVEDRKPVIMFPRELPFSGSNTENERVAAEYFKWLCTTSIPKLLLYAKPGVQIKDKQVDELTRKLTNLRAVYIGKGKHFIQEDQPVKIGDSIRNWVHTF